MNPGNDGAESEKRLEIDDPAAIVQALAEGRDPRTGTKLVGEGPWSSPDVIRALFLAARALERANRKDAGKAQANLPPAAGKPWTPEEDARLTSEFQTTKDFRTIAEMHQRTVGAVSARLVRLGLLPRANGRPG